MSEIFLKLLDALNFKPHNRKTCISCMEEKVLSEFYEIRKGAGKYRSSCKECFGKQEIKRNLKNDSDHYKAKYEKVKESRKTDEKYKEYQKNYREKRKEK